MTETLNPFRAGWENSKFYFKNLSALLPVYLSSLIFFLPSSYLFTFDDSALPLLGSILYIAAIAYIMYYLYQYDTKSDNYGFLKISKEALIYMGKATGYFTGVSILAILYACLLMLISYMMMHLMFDVEALASKVQEIGSSNTEADAQALLEIFFSPAVYFVITAVVTVLALVQLLYARFSFHPFKWLDTDFNPTFWQSFKICRGYSWRAVVSTSVSYAIMFIPATLILTILYAPILIFFHLFTGAENFEDAQNTLSPLFDAMASSIFQTPYLYGFLQYYKLMKRNMQPPTDDIT